MSSTDGGTLLGATAGPLVIRGAGAQAVMVMQRAALDQVIGGSGAALTDDSRSRIDLVLEGIQGTYDATALGVYLNLPEGGRPGDHSELLAGSVGLYGLRRASLPPATGGPAGLTFTLEAKPVLQKLLTAGQLPADEIGISVIPPRPLPAAVEIVVQRIALIWQKY